MIYQKQLSWTNIILGMDLNDDSYVNKTPFLDGYEWSEGVLG